MLLKPCAIVSTMVSLLFTKTEPVDASQSLICYDKAVKVLLVRHGQTNYNQLHLANDDPAVDVHLTKIGIQQAENLAEQLKNTDFERIFVSQLRRTTQTANIINRHHHVPLQEDARLNDNRSGFESQSTALYYAALDAAPDRWTTRLNGGESLVDVRHRVSDFVDYLRTTGYYCVLVVTSQIIVQAFYGVVQKVGYEEASVLPVDNGQCIELEV